MLSVLRRISKKNILIVFVMTIIVIIISKIGYEKYQDYIKQEKIRASSEYVEQIINVYKNKVLEFNAVMDEEWRGHTCPAYNELREEYLLDYLKEMNTKSDDINILADASSLINYLSLHENYASKMNRLTKELYVSFSKTNSKASRYFKNDISEITQMSTKADYLQDIPNKLLLPMREPEILSSLYVLDYHREGLDERISAIKRTLKYPWENKVDISKTVAESRSLIADLQDYQRRKNNLLKEAKMNITNNATDPKAITKGKEIILLNLKLKKHALLLDANVKTIKTKTTQFFSYCGKDNTI